MGAREIEYMSRFLPTGAPTLAKREREGGREGEKIPEQAELTHQTHRGIRKEKREAGPGRRLLSVWMKRSHSLGTERRVGRRKHTRNYKFE